MANMIIRPATGTGNKVIVQDQAGAAVLTTADSGAAIESNVTNNAGVATGTISPNALFPAGHIIQMNQTISQAHTTRSGDMSAYATTGITVTLANELQTNSKLYATLSAVTGESAGSHWSVRQIFTIYQNGTNVVGTQVSGLTAEKGLTSQGSHSADNQYFSGSHAAAILFTPAGTATAKKTVELYWRCSGTHSHTMHLNSAGNTSTLYDNGATILTLMEVAQ